MAGNVAIFRTPCGLPPAVQLLRPAGHYRGGPRPPRPSRCGTTARAAAVHLGERVQSRRRSPFSGAASPPSPGSIWSSLLAAPPRRPWSAWAFGGIRCSTRPDAVDGEVLSLLKAAPHGSRWSWGPSPWTGRCCAAQPPGPHPGGYRPGGGAHPRRGAGAGPADDDGPVRLHPETGPGNRPGRLSP